MDGNPLTTVQSHTRGMRMRNGQRAALTSCSVAGAGALTKPKSTHAATIQTTLNTKIPLGGTPRCSSTALMKGARMPRMPIVVDWITAYSVMRSGSASWIPALMRPISKPPAVMPRADKSREQHPRRAGPNVDEWLDYRNRTSRPHDCQPAAPIEKTSPDQITEEPEH